MNLRRSVAGIRARIVSRRTQLIMRPDRGFTLIELMLVIAIAGVLMAVAIPSFSTFMETSRLRSASSGLYEALIIARSEAIKRGTSVAVSPAASGWTGGWNVKSGTTTLREWQPETGVTFGELNSSGVLDTVGGAITYGSNGRIGGKRDMVVYIATRAAIAARCVSIDAGGRVNTRVDNDGDRSNGC